MSQLSDLIIKNVQEFCAIHSVDRYFLLQEPTSFLDNINEMNALIINNFFFDFQFEDFNLIDDSGINWNPNNQDFFAIIRKVVKNEKINMKLITVNLVQNLENLEKIVLATKEKAEKLVLQQINERQSRNESFDNIDRAGSIKRFLTDYTTGEIIIGNFPDILCVY